MIPQSLIQEVQEEIGAGYRMDHTLSVMEECKRLSDLFALNEAERRELILAALLHDLTKQHCPDRQRALYRHFSLPFGEIEENSPKTLHAVTGAYLARERYPDVVTPAVFSAILRHTTGAPAMTLTEKLLYLADYIEPRRTFPACVSLRRAFYDPEPESMSRDMLLAHLDRILLLSLDMTLTDLMEEGRFIHPLTVQARNDLITHRKESPWTI